MNPLDEIEIGTTGLRITRLGLGGAPFGGLFKPVGQDASVGAIRRALDLGIRYFDTAPLYGHGRSETVYSKAFDGVARDRLALSTKVGRVLVPTDGAAEDEFYMDLPPLEPVFDYSREGILRSLEDSLERLKLDRVDIALIHDPDDHYEQAMNEAYPTLADLKSQGVVKAIGAGMNQWQMPARFAREGDFDCFLIAGRYTLLDQSALVELLPICQDKQISIILGGPYNSGILASDLGPDATFDYKLVQPHLLDRARRIKAVCDRHGVPLKAAALQFGLAHPAVASTIPGARSIAELEENLRMAGLPIPADMWDELRRQGLIAKDAPAPLPG